MASSFDALKDIHKGRPAVVLGSGPSLLDDLLKIPLGSVLISVNARPLELMECDYVVFLDRNVCDKVLKAGAKSVMYGGKVPKRVSSHEALSNYDFPDHVWNGGFSSTTATYLACYMGCAPVILMGMDLYQGDTEYFDAIPGAPRVAFGKNSTPPIENHIKAWSIAKTKCPNSEVIRATGGALVSVFGKYDRGEDFAESG